MLPLINKFLTLPLECKDFIAALFISLWHGGLKALTTAFLFTPKRMVAILLECFEATKLLPLALIALCAFDFVDHYSLFVMFHVSVVSMKPTENNRWGKNHQEPNIVFTTLFVCFLYFIIQSYAILRWSIPWHHKEKYKQSLLNSFLFFILHLQKIFLLWIHMSLPL